MPPEADSPQAWPRFAQSDLALAEARPDARVLFENLCFHAQQAAEKSIKAVLVLNGVAFPKTHSLARLLDLLPPSIVPTQGVLDSRTLSGYATVTRYPGTVEPPGEEDYRAALRLATAVFAWAKEIVGSR